MNDNDNSADICRQCQHLLVKIDTTLNLMRRDYTKIIYVMLGMIASGIGLKFVGTPWYLYIFVYAALLSAVFLIGVTIHYWKHISFYERMIRIFFSVMLLYGTSLRVYFYKMGERLPQDLGILANLLYIIICILFMAKVLRENRPQANKERRQCARMNGCVCSIQQETHDNGKL